MKIIWFLLLALHVEANDMSSLLYNGNCITCHKATKAESAPAMIDIQSTYKKAFKTKKEFIEYMSKWVVSPNEDGSLMRHAIKKYELMPVLGFDEDTMLDISSFIYENDFTTNGERYWKK